MTEDESVSEYNERVLEIANYSLQVGEKIPESKIVRKVLRSLPRKFEEAQDITTLKLDELFGSLLTFEMAISDRESKKGKGSPLNLHMNRRLQKFKSTNTAGPTTKPGRKDAENFTIKADELSNKRNGDYGKKNEEVGRSFRYEDSNDNEVDHGLNAFTACITEINLDDSECSDKDEDEDLTFEKLKMLRKEDLEARAIQKERIQDLMEENE
ncbi:gag-proteinase polyprotein [Cucumis melo var. makuwa]|uniref:Gag-proteinase polyprotein n=1 Tax=Cucumis melo var. makuwa TaxID=1194695 RepID=A0A5D3C4M2_CUCMM|nr:gag-proteinase polyprotein [Cucumis melo var. makuwa]TYK05306.1 gag-proteinase polyprotein [Cucumis melo var. makuwa]